MRHLTPYAGPVSLLGRIVPVKGDDEEHVPTIGNIAAVDLRHCLILKHLLITNSGSVPLWVWASLIQPR